jgi:hypothetical protein
MTPGTLFLRSSRRCCNPFCRISPGLVLRSRVVRRDNSLSSRPFHTFAQLCKDQIIKNDTSATVASSNPEAKITTSIPTGTKSSSEGKLLQEKVVSTSDQRKADWAIMKEMTKYLWPKVKVFYFSLNSVSQCFRIA